MDIQRGHIYLVDFDPPKGEELKVGSEIMKRRPAVVMTRNGINRARRTVLVVPLSSSPSPVEIFAVSVPSAGFNAVAVCDQLTAVNKATRIIKLIGQMSRADLKLVETGARDAMGLSGFPS
jgi:mRNA interferase MazF